MHVLYCLFSFGLMVMIAINLSTWVIAVIEEMLHALHSGVEGAHGKHHTGMSFELASIRFYANDLKSTA